MSTKEFDKEYFKIGRINNNDYPLITSTENGYYEDEDEFIDDPETVEYRIAAPIPKNPVMVDYHKSPSSVISQKIHDVLEKLNLKDIQMIPATISGKDNEVFENYWFVNVYNRIPAVDRKKSDYSWNDFLEIANPIKKLVLNEELLNSIPLEDRLVFRLEENSAFEIYHKSVVDAIMATNPEGIQFTKVEDYHI